MTESSESKVRKRFLPAWMTGEKKPAGENDRKRTPVKRFAANSCGKVTVYCMNEAELVEAALCILRENNSGKRKREESEDNLVGGEPNAKSCVSTSEKLKEGSKQPSERRDPKLWTQRTVQTHHTEEKSHVDSMQMLQPEEEEEEDGLKLVREIFFTS
ncbi:cell cycle regulator of non-homologous end joining [Latimeria chalumnae]|uniref:cell cycle regulator of non-homologous end joining n=1 Tax=Latimeria chalumnae TaxID=7897 RepID=UPI0003C12449|nr:PREDICTED: modulator of retrovirus infection homolog [Latimeria chalumnae]XP_005991364.1 PREDICTED: modulator of retrovirus infection homolog [Latimeria chalumnae]|eukprot:XP_005991363.1 PREDICTED: modulator of retrovirus infection homolog [Latimeria chalumnae]